MSTVERYFNGTLEKLHTVTEKALAKDRLDDAMAAVVAAARMQYGANIHYTNTKTESLLEEITRKLPAPANTAPTQDRILFYDGFGYNSRGLTQIYLKALGKLGKLVYVTHAKAKNDIPDILDILQSCGAETVWVNGNTFLSAAQEICRVFDRYRPAHSFLYTTPSDVPALAAFWRNAGAGRRYQINLTDHAYWLGTSAFDKCIEFRDYGASISRDKRRIPAEKLTKVPFYPAIDFEAPFQGYPFAVPEGAKVVFSGGALYKTLGGENRYYRLVDYILRTFPEAIFWYAGFGDASQLNLLIQKYPGRVYFTEERPDLFQVLQHCFLYLSTYPVCGGLMFQYAASAGRIPVTLRYDDISDDFLLDQDDLGIQFETEEQVCRELDRLFTDEGYRVRKEQRVAKAVLDRAAFEEGLSRLLQNGDSGYQIRFKDTDTKDLRGEYLSNLTKDKVAMCLVSKRSLSLAGYMPLRFLRGAVCKIKSKLEEKWK